MTRRGAGPWAASLLAVLSLVGCGPARVGDRPPERTSIRVHDFRGKAVTLSRPARRVVCLLESALSDLYMLRADSCIVGVPAGVYGEPIRESYALLDPRLARHALPSPGNWDFISVEGVVALRPDLVVLWADQRDVAALLEARHIPVYAVQLRGFEDVERELSDLGDLTGTTPRADSLVAFIRGEVRALMDLAPPAARRPRAYFMWAQGPLESSGRGSTADALLSLGGAVNVVRDSQEHVVVHLEDLVRWDPELIVQWHGARPSASVLAGLAGWSRLAAVRRGDVHELPSPFLCDFWTPKYLIAARQVMAWVQPGSGQPGDLAGYRVRILTALYGPRGALLQ